MVIEPVSPTTSNTSLRVESGRWNRKPSVPEDLTMVTLATLLLSRSMMTPPAESKLQPVEPLLHDTSSPPPTVCATKLVVFCIK